MALRFRRIFVVTPLLLAWLPVASALGATSAGGIQFNRDIRPLLSDNCFRCHGPDKNNRKGKLRLDDRDVAVERGAIVPGKPGESELVKRIFTSDKDDVMPPPETNKRLTPAQKELLKKWIAGGAEYEPHWAYIKPTRPEVPKTKSKSWVRNPIDAFILHTLEARNLKPSREPDKRTLLRRLSLDLIGLPPTPGEVAAFVADKDPKAYDRQVQRLLASPHFGERMAVPWLDVVRFSDTVGYHGDQNQNIFPYRDYVINSFNQNKPFDQFTIEQLAGDLLPNPTVEQRVATGFNRLNMVTREGGAQPKEYLAKYNADRVRTVSMTWLGSTMGCAECHDHKYDPFSTRDFYSLGAFFADIKQWGVYADYNYTPNPDLKDWSNDHPFPPELELDSPYLQRRLMKLKGRIDELVATATAKLASEVQQQPAYNEWRQASLKFLKQHPSGWSIPEPTIVVSARNTNSPAETHFTVNADGTILFSGKPGEKKSDESNQIKLPLAAGWLSAIRLELIPHEGSIIRGGGESASISLTATLKPSGEGKADKLSFYHAEADHKEERYSNGSAIIGVQDVWRTSKQDRKSPQTAVWLLDHPVRVGDGDSLAIGLGNSAVGCVRVSISPFAALDPLESSLGESLVKALQTDEARRSPAQRQLAQRAYLLGTGWDADAYVRFKKIQRELLECHKGRALTLVSAAWEPRTARVLPRGNWQDETGAIVQPAPPHFLAQIPNPDGRRLNRLDLSRWLVSPENPLTARTIVNRLWKQFFGAGICNPLDDLGVQGDAPSHPELLDWLAVEFQESGWDVKHLVELMVTASAYRQDSNLRPELKEIDPNNRLLAHQSPRRLEAEFVRDNALFIAGLLSDDLGGPSGHPYQPSGYYVNLQFPDRDYHADLDERQYRRGVYTHWQRAFLHPMLANFDAPSREECTAYRTVSNTPQQALTLLNDPSFVEAARVFAQGSLGVDALSDDKRIDLAFQKALARPARVKEKKSLEQFLAAQRTHYRSNPEEAKQLMRVGLSPAPKDANDVELAAWTSVCRVILNLQETITCY